MSIVRWPFDPLPMFGFDLAVIDPPWHFDLYSTKGQAKSPQAQYETMTIGDIAALPVGDLLAPGGCAALWCTWPLLDQQIALLPKWGLEYKTGGVWAKRTASGKYRWGTGYLLRTVCEPFLIATLPRSGFRGASEKNIVDGLAREHSRKPDEFYSMLERIMPDARKVDVFSRQSRPGWATWGEEREKFDAAG